MNLFRMRSIHTYCAFKHCESIHNKEIELLKVKVEILEIEKNKKFDEIFDLNDRLEMVEAIIAEREEVSIAAAVQAAANNITPKEKGSKKRRKAKQHPTPSPVHNNPVVHSHLPDEVHSLEVEENSDSELALTAEEIAQLYEDEDPGES